VLRYEEALGAARFAVTDRSGGASIGPYRGLNLGGHVGDDPSAVDANRRYLAERLGVAEQRVLYMNQVHGADVVRVDGPWRDSVPAADALVTRESGLALAVLVADCVPVLLADPVAGVVGVAHAGRAGLVAGVVPAVVSAMRAAGGGEITARVGPSVCGLCYEVPDAMRAEVAAAVPEAWASTRSGGPALDIAAGVEAQLRAAGVTAVRLAGCTLEDPQLYSYRRDRVTGRFAGLAWLGS